MGNARSKQSKQLILLLDGTWNDADEGPAVTNIVRLRELINQSLSDTPVVEGAKGYMGSRRSRHGAVERQRLVFYQRGVGTDGLRDRILGGAFGEGVDVNVRRAYKFLSHYYAPGDEIFIFGFSRGAFTACSLVGLVSCSGLLKRDQCSPDLEKRAWDLYRTSPNDRFGADFAALRATIHDADCFKIACVGVFDTVGALGIPLNAWWRRNKRKYAFHNVELGSVARLCLHAIAIDEHREQFPAACWEKPRFKALSDDLKVEQVWFPGAHCDVGGGYVDEATRKRGAGAALDNLSLDWMVRRVKTEFPDFPIDLDSDPAWKPIDHRACALADQHHSRSPLYWLAPYVDRTIAAYADASSLRLRHPLLFQRAKFLSRERFAEPIEERVHISALERYGEAVMERMGETSHDLVYRPPSLTAVLPYIGATYEVTGAPERADPADPAYVPVSIVDWEGKKIPLPDPARPADPDRRVAKLFEGDSLRARDFRAACAALRRGADPSKAVNAQAVAAE